MLDHKGITSHTSMNVLGFVKDGHVGSQRDKHRITHMPEEPFGRGDDTVGNPRRAQSSQFEVVEVITLSKVHRQFSIGQLEATRAIRGSSISVGSILPPSECCLKLRP